MDRLASFTPIVLYIICIASASSIVVSGASSVDGDMCDVISWYAELQTDGVFNNPAPDDVIDVEEQIKTIISSSEDPEDVTVSCSVLASYEETLLGPADDLDIEVDAMDTGQDDDMDDIDASAQYERGRDGENEDVSECHVDETDQSKLGKTRPISSEDGVTDKKDEATPIRDEIPIDTGDLYLSEPPGSPSSDQDLVSDLLENSSEEEADAHQERKNPDVHVTETNGACAGGHQEDNQCDSNDKETHVESHPDIRGQNVGSAGTQPRQDTLDAMRAEYNTMLHDMEVHMLKLENRILMESVNKNSDTTIFRQLENQVLKLENELLRINVSFVLLHAENARWRALGEELKSSVPTYPALPDNATTMMQSLVTKHQDKITELSDVISKQANIIETINARAQDLDDRNSKLHEALINQSGLIETLSKHLGDIQEQQDIQNQQQRRETQKLYEKLGTIEEAGKSNTRSMSKDTIPPELTSGTTKLFPGESMGKSNIVLPTGHDQKVSGVYQEKEHGMENQISDSKNPLPPDTTVSLEKETKPVEKQNGKAIEADPVRVPLDEDDSDQENNVESSSGPDVKKVKENGLAKKRRTKMVDKTEEAKSHTGKSDQLPDVTKVEKQIEPRDSPSRTGDVEKPSTKQTGPGKESSKTTSSRRSKKRESPKGKPDVKSRLSRARKSKTKFNPPKPKYVDPEYKGIKDCYDHYLQGRKRDTPLRIRPTGMTHDHDVFCDMRNGGWTVFQRRQDGSTDFYRDWSDYKKGFGGMYGEHWLGLELLHRITNQGQYQLRVDLTDWKRNTAYAIYDFFLVDEESAAYQLHVTGYNGTAGDGMLSHHGMKFSTKDVDNDQAIKDFGGSCAKRFHGAWWYYKCYKSNLNGRYYRGGDVQDGSFDGVAWKAWTGSKVSLKKVEMKIRRKI